MDAWRRSLVVLCLGQFVSTMGLTVIVPLLPLYMEELGAGRAASGLWSGLALAAPAATLGVVSPLWGRLGDRLGRRWMVARALVGIGISIVLMGLARTPFEFLLSRLLQGACGGISDSAAAFAGAEAPPDARGRAQGLLHGATAAGSLAGPLVGGVLADVWDLRSLLLIAGALTSMSGLLAACVLRESNRQPVDVAERSSIGSAARDMLRDPRVRAFLLAGLCAQAGVYGLVTVFAPQVRAVLDEPARAATAVGMLQAITWAATMIAAPWWGRRNDRNSIEANFSLAAVGCGISIALQPWPNDVGWLFPLRALQGFCFSALGQSVYLQVSRFAGVAQQGTHVGLANSFLTAGQVIGALTGGLASGLLGSHGVFLLMGSFFGFGALLAKRSAQAPLETRYSA